MTKCTNDDYQKLIVKAITEPGTVNKCFSLFRNYSLFNTIYVGLQQLARFGNITPIKGYKAWNDLNRQVRKGEKALEVLFPQSVPEKDENGNILKDKNGKTIYKMVGFVFRNIHFAYSQTDVLDPSKETKDPAIEALNKFDWKLACQKLGIEIVDYNSIDGNCQGYALTQKMKLTINPLAKNPTAVAIHEMAHCLLHSKNCTYTSSIKEVQAETTSYIVLTMLGADEKILSDCRGYIQSWLKKNELTGALCKEIIKAADKILEAGTGKEKNKKAVQ